MNKERLAGVRVHFGCRVPGWPAAAHVVGENVAMSEDRSAGPGIDSAGMKSSEAAALPQEIQDAKGY